MTDSIPLHKLRRNKDQEAASDIQGISLPQDNPSMPTSNVAKAAVASRRNREYNSGRRNERYADDPEEEQGLLGATAYDEGDEDEETGRNLSPVSVSEISCDAYSHPCRCNQRKPRRLQASMQKTNHERYPSILQVITFSYFFFSAFNHPHRKASVTIPTQYCSKSKVQCVHIPPNRIL